MAITGAVKVTTVEVALRPLVKAEPVPNKVYNSTKLSLILSPPARSVSPVPSFADEPRPIRMAKRY